MAAATGVTGMFSSGDNGDETSVVYPQPFPDGVFYDQYRIVGTSVASPLLAGVVAWADQARDSSLAFVNPAVYSLSRKPSALFDVGPAGNQDQSRSDFANSVDNSDGLLFTNRIIDYEAPEQICTKKGVCTTRQVALHTARVRQHDGARFAGHRLRPGSQRALRERERAAGRVFLTRPASRPAIGPRRATYLGPRYASISSLRRPVVPPRRVRGASRRPAGRSRAR